MAANTASCFQGRTVSITIVDPNKPTEKVHYLDSARQMTLFGAYLKERENVDLVETEDGFAIYAITGNECYIRDIYVKPELRNQKVASKIADQVCEKAKKAGCKILTGSVCPSTKGADASLRVLQGYGMRLHSCSTNLIIFVKDLV